MAANAPVTDPDHVSTAMDYREHERTFSRFTNLVKWGIGIVAVLMVVLYFVIRP
jgi:hypothetical protein